MTAFTKYQAGTPCWVDVSTPDLDATRAFYGPLFGWTTQPGPGGAAGGHATFLLGGKRVAAAAPVEPGRAGGWTTYLASDDVEETAARVIAAGGAVVTGPLEVPDAGRVLVARDPVGASFGAWEAGAQIGAAVANAPGSLVWNELVTADATTATAFLQRVFDYAIETTDVGQPEAYRMLLVDGRPVAGVLQPGDARPGTSHWLTYFAVADTDATCAHVADLGGRVTYGPTDTVYGRLAVVADTTGARFAVIAGTDDTV